MAMLCLHCARRVVSPRTVSKYAGLEGHLKFRAAFTDNVKLTFARIDGLIGSNLPMAAYRDPAWWSNASSSAHAKAWLDAGWEVQEVNFKEGYAIFKKVRNVAFKKSKRKNSRLPNLLLLYLYISPDQRFPRTQKFQNSMHESRISNGNELCHASQSGVLSSSRRSIRSDFIKKMKNHNSDWLHMGLWCPFA